MKMFSSDKHNLSVPCNPLSKNKKSGLMYKSIECLAHTHLHPLMISEQEECS